MVVSARYQAEMKCSLQQAWQPPVPFLGSLASLEFHRCRQAFGVVGILRGLGEREAPCVSASTMCEREQLLVSLELAGVQSNYPNCEQSHQQSCQHYCSRLDNSCRVCCLRLLRFAGCKLAWRELTSQVGAGIVRQGRQQCRCWSVLWLGQSGY